MRGHCIIMYWCTCYCLFLLCREAFVTFDTPGIAKTVEKEVSVSLLVKERERYLP